MNSTKDNVETSYMLEQLSEFAIQDNVMSKITLTCCATTLSPDGYISLACAGHPPPIHITTKGVNRSEERRVGKGGRAIRSPDQHININNTV